MNATSLAMMSCDRPMTTTMLQDLYVKSCDIVDRIRAYIYLPILRDAATATTGAAKPPTSVISVSSAPAPPVVPTVPGVADDVIMIDDVPPDTAPAPTSTPSAADQTADVGRYASVLVEVDRAIITELAAMTPKWAAQLSSMLAWQSTAAGRRVIDGMLNIGADDAMIGWQALIDALMGRVL